MYRRRLLLAAPPPGALAGGPEARPLTPTEHPLPWPLSLKLSGELLYLQIASRPAPNNAPKMSAIYPQMSFVGSTGKPAIMFRPK